MFFTGLVIYNKEHKQLLISCKNDDWVSAKKVILPGKAEITAKDFYSGYFQNRNIKYYIFKS